MNTLSYTSLSDKIQTYGRTWYDREEQTLYANYTCGGFCFRVTGSFLAVKLISCFLLFALVRQWEQWKAGRSIRLIVSLSRRTLAMYSLLQGRLLMKRHEIKCVLI